MTGQVQEPDTVARSLSRARTPAAWSCTASPAPRRSTPSRRDQLLDTTVRGHTVRLDVVLAGRLQVGVAEEVGCDADLLRGAIHQLGHGAVAEQMRPDGVAEGPLGARRDLLANRPS
jgi:hypothetical protein